jgi:hypothetical protein
LSIDTNNEECPFDADEVYSFDECPPCDNDLQCDDNFDVCTIGTCNTTIGMCNIITRLDCSDNDPCTVDVCDSSKGCIHHYNTLNCDNSYTPSESLVGSSPCNISDQSLMLQNGYLCKNIAEERVALADPTEYFPYTNKSIVSFRLTYDIPPIPSGFFGKGTPKINFGTFNFTWCENNVQYVSISRLNSVNVNTSTIEISNIMATSLRLCSVRPITILQQPHMSWDVELTLSGNTGFSLKQKSAGYIAFRFSSDTEMNLSPIYLEVLPRLIFTSTQSQNVVKTLDYGSPSGYYMPYVKVFNGFLDSMDISSFHNSFLFV